MRKHDKHDAVLLSRLYWAGEHYLRSSLSAWFGTTLSSRQVVAYGVDNPPERRQHSERGEGAAINHPFAIYKHLEFAIVAATSNDKNAT